MAVKLNPGQAEARRLLASPATHVLIRGGSRCVSGDTVLDGHTRTIKELAEAGEPVRVRTSWGEQWGEPPFKKGTARLLEITTETGRRIRVTPDHRFWNGSRWVHAETLGLCDKVAVISLPYVNTLFPWRAEDGDCPCFKGYRLESVMAVRDAGTEDYYTLHVPGCEQYFANGFLNHNSGKTFLLIRAIVIRAMREPGTRHGIFRHRFNAIKHSIIFDTFPKVMRLCFPGAPYSLNKTDWFVRFPNGSEILFHGLDSSDRTEKILGLEFATVYLNEASQISYNARNMLLTRLAQKSGLAVKEYIDANPPTTSHWLYSLFERKVEPKGGEPLADPDDYATMQINPDANRENLSPEYLAQLESLPEKERQRFLFGNYQTAIDGALWTLDRIKRAEAITDENRAAILAKMRRIVVSVDPSGASGTEDYKSDEIGISVVGLDFDGFGHVFADLTTRQGPAGWAGVAVRAFNEWGADRIIAEKNFGGAMVEQTIRSVSATAPVKLVTASRGKVARAEPIAALYEQGKVFHHGRFPDLEEQLCQFSASGYQGARSPDRADAMVWGFSELMLQAQTGPAKWVPSPNIFSR